jgi:hypothetical protein
MIRFLTNHIHILLYAGFWISLASYGIQAPPDRILLLESQLITKGWHLTLLAFCFGTPVLALYWWRMRKLNED